MKNLLFLIVIALSACTVQNDQPIGREFYQIKEYTFNSLHQMEQTDQYLENALLPALKRKGIEHVGVFKNRMSEKDSTLKTYLLIPYGSIEEMIHVEDALLIDSTYLVDGTDYINAAYDEAPYNRMSSTLLRAFSDMPVMTTPKLDGPREDRIYELRSYESSTEAIYRNKVDMFNAGGEIILFDRLGFNAVFYGEVISGSKMPNLMYMTTHANSESRDQNWKNFVDSPEWKELISMDKYKNNISHIDIFLLYPTPYSDY